MQFLISFLGAMFGVIVSEIIFFIILLKKNTKK